MIISMQEYGPMVARSLLFWWEAEIQIENTISQFQKVDNDQLILNYTWAYIVQAKQYTSESWIWIVSY